MSNSVKILLLQSLNVIAFAVTVIVNVLASSLALNGVTTAEVSNRYRDRDRSREVLAGS